jgi:hypothetical protein
MIIYSKHLVIDVFSSVHFTDKTNIIMDSAVSLSPYVMSKEGKYARVNKEKWSAVLLVVCRLDLLNTTLYERFSMLIFISLLSSFLKSKVGLWDHLASCACACICIFPKSNLKALIDLCETWYLYDATWGHLNSILHKFPINNTNIEASKIVELLTLILFEFPNRSSRNLLCVSFHLRPS